MCEGHALAGVRAVVGGSAANMNKTFTTGLCPMENRPTALTGGVKDLPLWWLTPPPSPRCEACHWILSRPRAPYESSSLATPASLVGLWVLSIVLHDTKGKRRAVYSAP